MIDFKITFQADELFYGDYEKWVWFQKSFLENLYDNLKPKRHYFFNKV